MAHGVFINYRWGNDHGWVHAIWSGLERHIPPHKIFVDISGIRPGQHIRTVVEAAIRESDVLLPVIGPDWLVVGNGTSRRIDDPADHVRQEIVTALDGCKAVIPIVVDDAKMPTEDDLPGQLKPLAETLAVVVTHRTFREDMGRLVTAIFAAFDHADTERERKSATGVAKGFAYDRAHTTAQDGGTEWRTIAWFGIIGLLASFVSTVCYEWAAAWTSLWGIHGTWRILIAYTVGAVPFAVAWPLASYLAGFRTQRSLVFITLIFLAAWVITGLYWETMSVVGRAHFPIDREIISNLVIIGGWAAFLPRLRSPFYFVAAVLLGALGAAGSYLIARSSIPWDLALVALQGVCLNVPMCILVGYGVAHR